MASIAQCESAIASLAELLDSVDPAIRAKNVVDRSVSCTLKDLNMTFVGQLRDGGLHDVQQADSAKAQVRVTLSSDDLVSLANRELDLASAWARGRIRVDANVFDLLRLRSLL